jgi:prepilin signal peptidase PulO-like enzyme (type II secretory pathway)
VILSSVIIALIGILTGGVVNALADDLPYHRWPKLPRYPDGTLRPVTAWLGITAFLLGQRTSAHGSKLSWRHPLTEIATAALMVLTLIVTLNSDNVTPLQRVFFFIYMAIFMLIIVVDVEHRLILFAVIIPSCIIALLDAILTPQKDIPDLGRALLGAGLGFGVFFLMYLGGMLFSVVVAKMRGYELPEVAFGYGDVMLSTLCGLILGLERMIVAMFITVFLGAFGALIYLIVRRLSGRYNLFTPLPYGPYIVIGTLIMLLFSTEVRGFLFSF